MADDTVDNDHPSFVIIVNDTVKNEHPRVNASTLGDEAEGQQTNGSIVGSKNDVDNKDDIGETDEPGHQQTDETDDGTKKEDKNSEIDIKEEDNRETDTHGYQQTDDTDDGTKIKDKHSEIDIKIEDNRENDSIRPDQANVQLPEDKNDVRSKGKTSVHTKACSDDNIAKPDSCLYGQAILPKDDYKCESSNEQVTTHQLHHNCTKDDTSPNDFPKETEVVNYTEEKQRREIQDQKERLLHSQKGTEELQNDVEFLRNELANYKSVGEELVEKDISNQKEICRLKELIYNLQTRMPLICYGKRKNVMQNTVANEMEKQLHVTERQLNEAYQYQEKLREKCFSEIKEKGNQLQLLTYKFNQSLQDRDRFHQQVQALTEEKKELLFRLENEQQTHRKLVEEKEIQNKKHKKDLDEMRKKNCRIENELVQMKEENQRLRNDMEKEAEKHKKEMNHVYKKMEEKDKEIEKSKTIIQKQKDEISKIGGEICRLEELNSDLQTRLENELEQTRRKLGEEKETQNKKHKKDMDEMRKKMESKIAKKDEEIEKAKTDIQKHKDEISKITRENVMQTTVLKDKEKQLQAKERQLDEADQYQEKLHENFCSEIKEKDNQLQLLTYKFNQSLQDRDSFHQQVQALTEEKKDLLLRFSKVASAKMTYNNPNIADLSDEKRPTMLAEEFSELYDNEWTDAFEMIEEENEKEKLTFLLELLIRANQLCMDLSNRHTRKVKQSIATLTLLMPNRQEQHRTGECLDKEKLRQGEQEQNLQERVQAKDGSQSQTESVCGSDKKGDMGESQVTNSNDAIKETKPKKMLESDFEKLQTEQKKTILDATKYFETLLSEDVKKAVTEVIVNEKGIDEKEHTFVIAYLAKCIDLCWSMLVHKPPVHVDFPDITSDIPFDTNKYKTYKPYTKSGKHLEYLVWPALYLHEGGPLLLKGVAQGK